MMLLILLIIIAFLVFFMIKCLVGKTKRIIFVVAIIFAYSAMPTPLRLVVYSTVAMTPSPMLPLTNEYREYLFSRELTLSAGGLQYIHPKSRLISKDMVTNDKDLIQNFKGTKRIVYKNIVYCRPNRRDETKEWLDKNKADYDAYLIKQAEKE